MLKDITIGQYFPGQSAVHRLDPRMKIILTMLYIVALFVADNFQGLLLSAVFAAAGYLISGIPLSVSYTHLRDWSPPGATDSLRKSSLLKRASVPNHFSEIAAAAPSAIMASSCSCTARPNAMSSLRKPTPYFSSPRSSESSTNSAEASEEADASEEAAGSEAAGAEEGAGETAGVLPAGEEQATRESASTSARAVSYTHLC